MKKSIIIALSVLLLFSLYALPVLSQQKTWSVTDRAIIAGILFNPGYGFGCNPSQKTYTYDCYFGDQYLNRDSSELAEKTLDFFQFFSFFVIDRKKGLVNNATLAMYNLKHQRKHIWTTDFENMRPDPLDATNRLKLLARALIFSFDEFSIDNETISMEWNADRCPKTLLPFNMENYFALFAFVVKDYVLKDNNEFKALKVKYIVNGKPKMFEVSFDNKIFNDMYSRKYFTSSKK